MLECPFSELLALVFTLVSHSHFIPNYPTTNGNKHMEVIVLLTFISNFSTWQQLVGPLYVSSILTLPRRNGN